MLLMQAKRFEYEYAELLQIAALSILAFVVFVIIQFATDALVGTDGYYHLKLALLLKETSLADWPLEFPWLPLTVLSPDRYVDHHFLFHVFIIPFTVFSEIVGGKIAAAFFAAAAFCGFQIALPRLSLPARILASGAFFAISPAFLYRMSMLRAQSLSLAMLMLIFVLLTSERKYALGAAAFAFVWMYNAFPLIALLLGCFSAAEILVKRRIPWSIIIWGLGGMLLGLIVNPYFPANIIFLFHHLVDKFQPGGYAVKVGTEWYPYESEHFFTHGALSLALLGLALHFAPDTKREGAEHVWTALIFALVLLAMLLKSRRFIELFPPFALLSAVWSLQISKGLRNVKFLKVGAAMAATLALAVFSILSASDSVSESKDLERYKDSALWLKNNTPKGSLVFMSDWDDFPRLFYWNAHNTYLAGLDPYFFYATDPARFHLWRRITRGKLKAPPGPLIKGRFGSRYIFIDRDHEKLRMQLEKDQTSRQLFKSGDSYVYEVASNHAVN